VTAFNRGKTNADLFSTVEYLHGDRDGKLDALRGRRWDAVVDTSGFFPRVVRQSAELLKDSVGHYTFISTISVYADAKTPGQDESAPLATLKDEGVEEITGETYGALKALCERVVEEVFPSRSLHVRAGLIVGPNDYTDRFAYWPRRVGEGGEVLAPGDPKAPVQMIDVRDLAEWIVRMIESGATGTYNATGPDRTLSLGEILETCRAVTGSDATLTWVPEAFLLERKVEPWTELPLWLPASEAGFMRFDCRKAFSAGLSFRPLADTVRDTWRWDEPRAPEQRKSGSKMVMKGPLTREREAELLAKAGESVKAAKS
jgi:2'-hydroxyisoflavone reductase